MRRRSEPEMATALLISDEGRPIEEQVPLSQAAVEPEEAPGGRSLLRAGMTVVWMILLAAGYAWRACSQQ
jgi:hypothetical protein